MTYLGGAGLAAPDLGLEAGVTPFDFVADDVDVTPSRVGRDTDVVVVVVVTRRVGMRLWLPSSANSFFI